MGQLYFSDNLDILREHIPDGSAHHPHLSRGALSFKKVKQEKIVGEQQPLF